MSGFIDDVRFGARTIRRSPGFSTIVIATLGVGIAAATLVFSIVNSAMYRLYDGYPDPGRLVLLLENNLRLGASSLASTRAVSEWKVSARSFEQVGGMEAGRVTLAGHGEPLSVSRIAVTEDALPMLGARTDAGRAFVADDFLPAAPPVVLLGNGLWRERFCGRADIVGSSVRVDGQALVVAGVLSREFTVIPFLGAEPGLVVPIARAPAGDRSRRNTFALARLRSGVTVEQAAAEMQTIAAATAAADPAARGWDVTVRTARGLDFKGDAGFVLVVAVGVGFVLLIVCANVANLLLCRAASRSREIATRLAVGAGRLRIARQLLTESLLLAVAGALAGLFLSWWACRVVSWLIAGTQLGFLNVSLDARATAFAALLSVMTALAASLAPALRSAGIPIFDALRERRTSVGALSPGRLRSLLVISEVGLAVVLLAGGGLVLQSLGKLRSTDPGFDPRNLASVSVTLSADRYAKPRPKADYVADALARFNRHRELQAAATSFLPAIGGELRATEFTVDGRAPATDAAPSAGIISVSPTFFGTMRIPVRAGRAFEPADREGSLGVAAVNERLAEKWFGGQSPIGSRIVLFGEVRAIVGVVGDVRTFHLNIKPAPTIYLPYDQRPSQSVGFVLRRAGDPAATIAAAKADLQALDRDQAIRGGASFEKLIAESLGGFDMTSAIVGVMAAVALGLAAVGLYSVIAYSVARRTREIGIRLTLGAGPGRIAREVVGEGLRLALAGGLPGLLMSIGVGKLLAFQLHGVSAMDPRTLGITCVVVLATVMAASYIPARRAARVDPAVAARAE